MSGAQGPPYWNVAAVAFFNAKPLLAGLDTDPAIDLRLAVPSRLLPTLLQRTADVALLPVIDYQHLDGASLLPAAGGIACDGPTLTVRLFAKAPLDRVRRLCCDTDSHTSVVLSQIVLKRHAGVVPTVVPLPQATGAMDEARLLIGDKVVLAEPAGFPHQLDLGAAWKEMTGLPFVFACWTARTGVDLGDLPQRLEAAKRRGLTQIDDLVTRYALPTGWPADIARRYLMEYLKFDLDGRHLEAIRRFHAYAAEDGHLPGAARELQVLG